MLEYSHRTPGFEELYSFLRLSDKEFDIPLSDKLDLEVYARKLWENSTCITCREDGVIVGMLNCYTNRPPQGYISNVCILGDYQGKGIFVQMFSELCSVCHSRGITEILLQVNKGNHKAIKSYSKLGFVEHEDAGDTLYLKYIIPTVTVICCAYNHESFIRQTLEGFVMQNTSFKVEFILHDDASTDNTAEIIREYELKYSDIIRPIYQKENQYSRRIGIFRVFACPQVRGKYVAICEGDDYWTDPLKLQKQVDYMEAHPEVSVCATEGYVYNQASGQMSPIYDSKNTVFYLKNFLRSNPISTVSTLSRAEWLLEYQTRLAPLLPHFLMGDYPMWFYMAKKGPVILLKDKCFVYRELAESASHFTSPYKQMDFYISTYDIKVYFNDLLKIGKCFMGYRRFRDVRRECRRVVRNGGVRFCTLYLYSLKKLILHPSPGPSRQAKELVKDIFK